MAKKSGMGNLLMWGALAVGGYFLLQGKLGKMTGTQIGGSQDPNASASGITAKFEAVR